MAVKKTGFTVYDLPVPGKRSQGRQRLRWRDMVKRDTGTRGLTREETPRIGSYGRLVPA
jgi:hypothetical protein